MARRIVVILFGISLVLGVSGLPILAQQSLPLDAQKIRKKVEKRAADNSRTKVKLRGDSTYIGTIGDVGDHEFTMIDKSGNKQTIKYVDVKSIGGTGFSTGAKIGLGIAIGAGAVLGVLAAIVASDN